MGALGMRHHFPRRAMSAAARTGIRDDELDLLQILKAGIQWLLLIQEG